MKVFISHSWKNKTEAQKIADELKAAGIDLWLDANNLLPGQLIQETIDDVLEKMDLVVLVWSKDASESGGVAAEIYTSSRLQKMIIPCNLDLTAMDAFPYLRQIKGIHFNDFENAIGRLKMVLLNYMSRGFGMQNIDGVKAMNEFMGSLETANHLIYKEDIKNKGSESDKEFWVNKIQHTERSASQKLSEEEKAGKEIMAFLSEQMKTLESNLNKKAGCKNILNEMKAYRYASHPAMQKFISSVQNIYDSFEDHSTDEAIPKFKKEMEEKLQASRNQVKTGLGWLLPDFLFEATFENIRYFFLSAADNLEKLLQLGRQKDAHPLIADCANELLHYIKTPGGIIDNYQYGILGYADDAYFIQSLLANMQTAGIVDAGSWNLDWLKINAGSEIVFNLVGNGIRQQLDENIREYCNQLQNKYNPAVSEQLPEKLQAAKDDVWKAKLMSLQTSMIHNPVW